MRNRSLNTLLCFILAVVFILTGCGKAANDMADETPFSMSDMQIGYDGQACFENMFSSITKAENGYYYFDNSLKRSENSKPIVYLMYFDEASKNSVPVCSKANCEHTEGYDCDATFGLFSEVKGDGPYYLWYYEGNLYTVIIDYESNPSVINIYKISPDGSTRTKFIKFYEGESSGFNMYFHRGYVYASLDIGEDKTVLYRVKLEKNAKPEIVYEASGIYPSLSGFDNYKTGITFEEYYYLDDTFEECASKIKYYNPVTNEVTELMGERYFDSYKIVDDSVFYSVDGKIFKHDVESGKEELFSICDYPVYLSYDGDYVYAEVCSSILEDLSEHYIYVIDKSGNIVDTICAPSEQDCMFGDNKYLFQMFDLNDKLDGRAERTVIKAFDKSQIGTGDYEWIELPIE